MTLQIYLSALSWVVGFPVQSDTGFEGQLLVYAPRYLDVEVSVEKHRPRNRGGGGGGGTARHIHSTVSNHL